MKIFEFAFNPRKKKDRFFNVFSYEPKKAAEKSRGSLYIVGELDHALEFNARFLKKLSLLLQASYYGSSLKTPALALKEALKKANAFLSKESKSGNVDWLGNLHLAVMVFVTQGEKKTVFHMAKTGTMSVVLTRDKGVVDVGKEAGNTVQPGRVFGNIVSAKLVPEDSILLQSHEVHGFLSKEKSMGGVGSLKENKEFKDFFSRRSRLLSQTSGILLSFVIEEEIPKLSSKNRALFSRFSFPNPRLLFKKGMSSAFSNVKLPQILLRLPLARNSFTARRRGFLLALLFFLLFLGFLMFQGERGESLRNAEEAAEKIETLATQAEDALIFQNTELANELFYEAWSVAVTEVQKGGSFKETFLARKKELEEKLAPLNNMRIVEDPELLFEVSKVQTDLVAQRLMLTGTTLYVSNPFSKTVVIFDIESKEQEKRTAPENVKLSTAFEDAPLFFASPNFLLSFFENGAVWQQTAIELPAGFVPTAMESFNTGLYMADKEQGEIIKYAHPLSPNTTPVSWLSSSSKETPVGISSMSIDGNIWTLSPKQEIKRYFTGTFQENLEVSFFPPLNNATTLLARENLYLLEPATSRVAVLTASGKVARQYVLPQLTELLDIAVSQDGKTIYLLNGQGVYRIENAVE